LCFLDVPSMTNLNQKVLGHTPKQGGSYVCPFPGPSTARTAVAERAMEGLPLFSGMACL
jgi:hypothetical protein